MIKENGTDYYIFYSVENTLLLLPIQFEEDTNKRLLRYRIQQIY